MKKSDLKVGDVVELIDNKGMRFKIPLHTTTKILNIEDIGENNYLFCNVDWKYPNKDGWNIKRFRKASWRKRYEIQKRI